MIGLMASNYQSTREAYLTQQLALPVTTAASSGPLEKLAFSFFFL